MAVNACPRCSRPCVWEALEAEWLCRNCGRRWQPASIDSLPGGMVRVGAPVRTIRVVALEVDEPKPPEVHAQASAPAEPLPTIDWSDPTQAVGTTEAATLLGVIPRRARAMVRAGRLRAKRVGRDWRVLLVDVERVIRERRRSGRPRVVVA